MRHDRRQLGGYLSPDDASKLDDAREALRRGDIEAAALSANRELIKLYWDLGKSIVDAQKGKGYGKQVVQRLAVDLRKEFPGVAGFSAQNIWKMRAFYLAWTDQVRNVSQVARETRAVANLSQSVRDAEHQATSRDSDGGSRPCATNATRR